MLNRCWLFCFFFFFPVSSLFRRTNLRFPPSPLLVSQRLGVSTFPGGYFPTARVTILLCFPWTNLGLFDLLWLQDPWTRPGKPLIQPPLISSPSSSVQAPCLAFFSAVRTVSLFPPNFNSTAAAHPDMELPEEAFDRDYFF